MSRWSSLATLVCAAALLAAGCGDADSTSPTPGPASTPADVTNPPETTSVDETASVEGADPGDPGDSPGQERGDAPSDDERAAAATDAAAAYRSYIDAINARDGAALCDLLSPAALRELKPPVERASCAATMHDSIGYRDPRGFPVWERTHLSAVDGSQVSNDLRSARITAAIVTQFADRDEPSVESDIAYLEMVGGRWRLAKPSGALYRAVGNAELPPSVIVPPQG